MSRIFNILERFRAPNIEEQFAHVKEAVQLLRDIIEKPEYLQFHTETEEQPMLVSMEARMLL